MVRSWHGAPAAEIAPPLLELGQLVHREFRPMSAPQDVEPYSVLVAAIRSVNAPTV
jgi:hypothetical protein